MSKNHYAVLRATSQQVAETWPRSRSATRKPADEFLRYNGANDALITDIQRANPLIGREVVKPPMPHGTAVLFRYCHIASLVGREDSTSTEELVEVLRNPESFATLELLLTQDNKTTRRMETELGLVPLYYPAEPESYEKWTIQDGALKVPEINLLKTKAQLDCIDQGHEIAERVCLAHRAKIIEPLFQSVVTICGRDENLFDRSLAGE
ncbi:MAG TPA: hypothetical protein VGE34_00840 [Candidatus Saccharimonadales bacterium]